VTHLSEDGTEQLLCGMVTADSAEVATLLTAVRSEFAVAGLPPVGVALSEFVDPAMIAIFSSVPAFTASREPRVRWRPSVLAGWRCAEGRR
jgi:hypothetical protein